MNLREQQINLELESLAQGTEQYMAKLNEARVKGNTENFKPEQQMLMRLTPAMAKGIEEYVLTVSKGDKAMHYTKTILTGLDIDAVAYLTVQQMVKVYAPTNFLTVTEAIGKEIEHYHNYLVLLANAPGYMRRVEDNLKTSNTSHRKIVYSIIRAKLGVETLTLTKEQIRHIGHTLLKIYIETTGTHYIDLSNVNAGKHGQRNVTPTDDTIKWLNDYHSKCADMACIYYPMVCIPEHWKGLIGGGYITDHPKLKKKLIRSFSRAYTGPITHNTIVNERVIKIINIIQQTKWRINRRVMQVINTLKNTKIGGLPEMDLQNMLPEKPWLRDETLANNDSVIKAWKREARNAHTEWAYSLSKRNTFMQQLLIANKFADYDAIYFSYFLDWRGRIYPVQNFLNPQADSIGKSLLEFADGKALGKTGAKWLAIHGANVYGKDKFSLTDREQWVKDNQRNIIACAENPLDFLWWAEAEKPYQFLAFCFEWAGYVKEGESHVCHLPIAVDASCSGLQHFSALLKDEIGGAYVNLTPQPKPNDVYMAVAREVIKIVEADTREEAQLWKGKIDRGIVKRNVMTLPYGAKRRGFEDQLIHELNKRDLKGAGPYLNSNAEDQRTTNRKASIYLAKCNEKAISKVVVKAFEAMGFLKNLAQVLAKKGVGMEWYSPLGLHIAMWYPKYQQKRLKLIQSGVKIKENGHESVQNNVRIDPAIQVNSGVVDSNKQVNGSSPNVIHSFDAAHLQTVVESMNVNYGATDFALIHDSFGTHATDMDKLSKTLRETFIKQYTPNHLEAILETNQNKLTDEEYAELLSKLPKPGNLNLNQVLESDYFCS